MDLSPYTSTRRKKTHFNNNNKNNNNNIAHHHHAATTSSAIDMHHRSNQHRHTTSTSRCSSDSGGHHHHQDHEDSNNNNNNNKWASKLLMECAKAISQRDSSKIQHLLWMLNELSSPYGDLDQKLASYFLQALFCKATESGQRCFNTLTSVAHNSHSFDSARKLILKFQEVSPWTTFGHVASNGAILEALEGESKLHIIDVSDTLCTQWPTLLEALATRNDETPHLKLTVVAITHNHNHSHNHSIVAAASVTIMKEVGQRMEKFARLMGVPFEFNVINGFDLDRITKEGLGINDDEAVAVNCVGALRRVQVEQRESVIRMFKSIGPKVFTVVEEEADFCSDEFVQCFEECLKFYSIYFEMLEESFPPTSNERLMLERDCSRSIVRVLACGGGGGDEDEDGGGGCERRERGTQWCERLNKEFSAVGFSDDVVDDVKALLKRYKPGWSLVLPQPHNNNGIYLTWKEEPVVWASAWKP